MSNLKNWFLPVLGTLALILDMGFDVVNPILTEIGIPAKIIGAIKTVFGLYAIWKMAHNKSLDKAKTFIATPRVPKKD